MRTLRRFLLALSLVATLACSVPAEVENDPGQQHLIQGQEQSRQGHLHEAETSLQAAVEAFAERPTELAPALNDLSDVLFRLGDYASQEAVLWRALEVAVTAGDRSSAASSWNNLGVSFAARGRPSAALAAYHQCLELRRDLDDPAGSAATRHNLGVQQLLLGRVPEGVAELRQAVAARRRLGDSTGVGQTLASLAWGLSLDHQQEAALAAYAEAISLLRQEEAVHDLAIALEQRAQLRRALGRFAEARQDLQESLALLTVSGGPPPLHEAYLQLGLASLEREEREHEERDREQLPAEPATDSTALNPLATLTALRSARATFDQLGGQEGRILARLELARLLRRSLGGREEAIAQLTAAIAIVEAARSDLQLPSFRATFLGGWQTVYQELVDILASAALTATEEQRPLAAQELAGRALAVAERARARALLDRIATADAPGPWPSAESGAEQGRRSQVKVLEELEGQALGQPGVTAGLAPAARGSDSPAESPRAALRRARFALERMEEVSLRAALPQGGSPAATPASVDAIRRQLDEGTVLLVYALAPRRSWLWRLDRDSVQLTPLPPGGQIETAARNAHQLLPRSERTGYRKAARAALQRLTSLLLAPVLSSLGEGRLAIVPDGALHLIPFGALPVPTDTAGTILPLVASHEIVHLPSASTLVELRRRAARPPAPELLALVADPVFQASDSRLAQPGASRAPKRPTAGPFQRLPATATEAAVLAAIGRQASGVEPPIHQGFAASRELVTGGTLDRYRILHFATHGVVDSQDPALGGLILSLFNSDGQPQDGLLRARDLYDLRLSADLVVLSACRTALGQEVRGEGLVGLADGFFAAGARQLVVSLWEVDDRATAELMTRFYRHLLLAGRHPADALRCAQIELRNHTEWRSPAHWAAFIVLGDWRWDGLTVPASYPSCIEANSPPKISGSGSGRPAGRDGDRPSATACRKAPAEASGSACGAS